MKTYQRICIQDFMALDSKGNAFHIERGKKYTTSELEMSVSFGPTPIKGHVTVFGTMWVLVPIECFAREH